MAVNPQSHMSFVKHLEELRRRIIRVFVYFIVLFSVCAFFAEKLFAWLREPLASHLPKDAYFIATTPISGWIVYMKVALLSAAVLTVPLLIFEIIGFMAPGLKTSEKKSFIPMTIAMSLFFYGGLVFAYFCVLPASLSFLTYVYDGTGIKFLPNIEDYFDFTIVTMFGFGLIFLVPFLVLILITLGIVSPDTLAKARPYTIVGAFIVGAILTPPDVASQILMSVPFILLFELGLLMGRIVLNHKAAKAHS